ncbi:hypothetical protein ACFSW8_15785 [Rubritalea tangerina]|uniref:Uncharacterized protein n=1 Tax=Rubritalea tangerina TaxID=430798 RepID=A0ABW4ZER2_9BACT
MARRIRPAWMRTMGSDCGSKLLGRLKALTAILYAEILCRDIVLSAFEGFDGNVTQEVT